MRFQGNRKRFWAVGCGLAVISLAFMGHMALSQWLAPAPAPVQVAAKTAGPKAARPATPVNQSTYQKPVGKAAEGQPSAPIHDAGVPAVPVAGNLAVITKLRAQLEELRIQSAIAQEQEKILPKSAVAVSSPPPLAEVARPSVDPPRKSSPVVVSVQGVDGRSTATVRLASGELVSVRPGDRFNGGVVGVVNRTGVTIRRAGASSTLAFE